MGTLFTVRDNERTLTIDVGREGARAAKVYGRAEQLRFAQSIATTLGVSVEEQPLIHQGKRGVSNVGFRVVLWKKEQA